MPNNDQQIIRQISEIITQTPDIQQALQQAIHCLIESADAGAGGVFVIRPQDDRIVLYAAHGIADELAAQLPLELSPGSGDDVIRNSRSVNDRKKNLPPELLGVFNYLANGYHSLLLLPLIVGGRPIGSLALASHADRPFPQRVVNSIETIIPPLAFFLLNAFLVDKLHDAGQTGVATAGSAATSSVEPTQDVLLKGRAITKGVSCGYVQKLVGVEKILQPKNHPDSVTPEGIAAEKKLFADALRVAREDSANTAKQFDDILAEADSAIFAMHTMLLDDPTLKQQITIYLDQGFLLTDALGRALRDFNAQYQKIEDPYLRERISDIKDVMLRLKNAADNLRGSQEPPPADVPKTGNQRRIILVARELLTSQLVSVPLKHICGIICEEGGTTSHTAILARALQIPMLVGVPGIMLKARSGDCVIMDCGSDSCYLRASTALLRRFAGPIRLYRNSRQNISDTVPPEGVLATADGASVRLMGNITLLSEVVSMHHYGIRDIGLYRTEFMFMIRNAMPSEEDQFSIFSRMLKAAAGATVTIRLLDAGGDKPLPYFKADQEDNPALGWRGLRFLLSNPKIMAPHLRAILRASALGDVHILVPMVADLNDLLEVKQALALAAQELRQRGVKVGDYRLGIMIEVPAVLYGLDRLLPEVDFVSIGTNDLVQFLFAVDRANARVSKWFRQCHPVVLRALGNVCRQVHNYEGKTVSLCGELASSRRALPLLLGAGLRQLSMTPHQAPALRPLISQLSIPDCEKLYARAILCETEADVMKLVDEADLIKSPSQP
ncbi:MAG: phosphoenolpyruvate--protein phosphotransferase [Lentisphaeria bacterium]|jgi:phosphotransferase system enzyme I (PtsP)